MGIPDHLTCLLRKLYAGKETQLEPNIEQWIFSKLRKEYIEAAYYHPVFFNFYAECMHAKSLQLCLTLCDPMDFSPPGSCVHGIIQAGILEWAALPSFRGSSQPRDVTHISLCLLHWQVGSLPLAPLTSGFSTSSATWEVRMESTS